MSALTAKRRLPLANRGLPMALAVLASLAAQLGLADEGAAVPGCLGRAATILRLGGDADVRGTAKADVILTGPGADTIDGGGGNDRICSGAGADRVLGGTGADRIDAGAGTDLVEGGNGSDEVRAGAGRDTLIGNRGNDRLIAGAGAGDFLDGGLGDDTLDGGPGAADQLIGGVGNDRLDGGSGDGDLLRGDEGKDLFDGGPGRHDVASFATARGFETSPGVSVQLRSGSASGDGRDRIAGIEDVVGSPFGDQIEGDALPNVLYGAGGRDILVPEGPEDAAFGGSGSDLCAFVVPFSPPRFFARRDSCAEELLKDEDPESPDPTVAVEIAGGSVAATLTAVYAEGRPPLGVPPSPPTGFGLEVTVTGADWVVTTQGLPIAAGESCTPVVPFEVRCRPRGQLDAIVVDGGPEADAIEIDSAIPSRVPAVIRGGEGADTIVGGSGDDNLEGSVHRYRPLADVVLGRGGDDAIANAGSMRGGPGSDLLIARVCAGEQIDGGAGIDSVSFAREGAEAPGGAAGTLHAELGGEAFLSRGRQRQLPCDEHPPPTRIHADVERIEGSPSDDVLVGSGSANTLLGRGGDDLLLGRGGDDILVGGTGHDSLEGETGFDRLYAVDGQNDPHISCASSPRTTRNSGVALSDPGDAPAQNCR